uniref:Uncharacterized protein n=1 Tax=Lygus hesperus TaxID=30085 RepID=A0A0A9WCK9_LYGHE
MRRQINAGTCNNSTSLFDHLYTGLLRFCISKAALETVQSLHVFAKKVLTSSNGSTYPSFSITITTTTTTSTSIPITTPSWSVALLVIPIIATPTTNTTVVSTPTMIPTSTTW